MVIFVIALASVCVAQTSTKESVAMVMDYSTIPIVPADIVISGRQAIANHLMFRVDHVYLKYSGRSIISGGLNDRYFGRDELRELGYVHDGSFTELSDALASVPLSAEVVPTPEGYYEVMVNVTYYTADNRESFTGSGWLNIYRDHDGNLTAGEFQPYVSVNNTVGIQTTADIRAAKWVGRYGNELDLPTLWFSDGTHMITIPSHLLEDGNLLMADWEGNISGWNLSTGTVLDGKRILALLGQTRSGDIQILRNPSVIDAGSHGFYRSGDMVYGRFPLLDVTTDVGFNKIVNFTVPVWGSNNEIAPSAIFVTPVRFERIQPEELIIGREYRLPTYPDGGFILAVPAGEYNIRVEFNGVLDWAADPNPKG